MKKETKLHEVLAFEADVRNKSKALVQETITTFTKKQDHFTGLSKTYVKIEDDGEDMASESKQVVTTVGEKMAHITQTIINAINVTMTKEETNSSNTAVANLTIGDTDFGQFSATGLLFLENTLKSLRNDLYKNIPTLDNTKSWMKDSDTNRPSLFLTEPQTKFRTVSRQRPIVLYEATANHPAQVAMENFTVQVGKYQETAFAGQISSKSKAAIIERMDTVIFSVKTARARANNVVVVPVNVGKAILEFIHGSDLT